MIKQYTKKYGTALKLGIGVLSVAVGAFFILNMGGCSVSCAAGSNLTSLQSGACDSDNDGISDNQDNCVNAYNPTQADADNDKEGDACDSNSDSDSDEISDSQDNCPLNWNPDQTDRNNDGIGDICNIKEAFSISDHSTRNQYKFAGTTDIEFFQDNNRTFMVIGGSGEDGFSLFQSINSTSNSAQFLNRQNISKSSASAHNLDGLTDMATLSIGGRTYLFTAAFDDHGISAYLLDGIRLVHRGKINHGDNQAKLNRTGRLVGATVGNNSYLFIMNAVGGGVQNNAISVIKATKNGEALTMQQVHHLPDNNNILLFDANRMTTAQIGNRHYLFATASDTDASSDTHDGISIFEIANNGTLTHRLNISDADSTNFDDFFDIKVAQVGNRHWIFAGGAKGLSVIQLSADGNTLSYTDTLLQNTHAFRLIDSTTDTDLPLRDVRYLTVIPSSVANRAYVLLASSYYGRQYYDDDGNVHSDTSHGMALFDFDVSSTPQLRTAASIADNDNRLLHSAVALDSIKVGFGHLAAVAVERNIEEQGFTVWSLNIR